MPIRLPRSPPFRPIRLPSSMSPRSSPRLSSTSPKGTRLVSFLPSLPTKADDSALYITFNPGKFASAAVSFKPAGLLHTQLSSLNDDETPSIVVRLTQLDSEQPVLGKDAIRPLWNALWCYVSRGSSAPSSFQIDLPLPSPALHSALVALGAEELHPSYRITRSALFQLFQLSGGSAVPPPFPYLPMTSPDQSTTYPRRPPKPAGTIYSRRIPHLDEFFKLEVCTPNDVALLHNWFNNPRVDHFWGSKGTWEDHESYLASKAGDPHVVPVVGSFINARHYANEAFPPEEEFLYSEIYYVKEDAFGGLLGETRVRDYDRGIHVLVGSNSHRGSHRVKAWLPSLVHYCFLDEPRSERVLAEPNAANEKMIKYFESVGFVRQGTVEFPHKTAQVMVCDKNKFYELCPF